MRPGVLLGVPVLCVIAISSADAQSVKYYRRLVPTRSSDPSYAVEVPPRSSGTYYRVERDLTGRVTHVITLRNGEPIVEWFYDFDGDSKLPRGYRTIEASETKGLTKLIRNSRGDVIRSEDYTVAGVLTSYWTAANSGDTIKTVWYFTATGKEMFWLVHYYSPTGRMRRTVQYVNPEDSTLHIEYVVDSETGQSLSATQMAGGQIQNRQHWTYNADGDLVRHVGYMPDGSKVATDEYTDGFKTKRSYAEGLELRYSYDGHSTLTETQVWFGGHFVCRLTYDRMSDLTVKRTIAVGPHGELWAEYPDQLVLDVTRDGRPSPPNHATIYKGGNWW
jgi:hypothetical protein